MIEVALIPLGINSLVCALFPNAEYEVATTTHYYTAFYTMLEASQSFRFRE